MQKDVQNPSKSSPSPHLFDLSAGALQPIPTSRRRIQSDEFYFNVKDLILVTWQAALAGLLLGATYYQMSLKLAGVIRRRGHFTSRTRESLVSSTSLCCAHVQSLGPGVRDPLHTGNAGENCLNEAL